MPKFTPKHQISGNSRKLGELQLANGQGGQSAKWATPKQPSHGPRLTPHWLQSNPNTTPNRSDRHRPRCVQIARFGPSSPMLAGSARSLGNFGNRSAKLDRLARIRPKLVRSRPNLSSRPGLCKDRPELQDCVDPGTDPLHAACCSEARHRRSRRQSARHANTPPSIAVSRRGRRERRRSGRRRRGATHVEGAQNSKRISRTSWPLKSASSPSELMSAAANLAARWLARTPKMCTDLVPQR